MRHHLWEESKQYPVAILIKESSFGNKSALDNSYVKPLGQLSIPSKDVIAFSLKYNDSGKAPAGFIKKYLDTLLPSLASLGVRYLYVADSNYFKVLTKSRKADPHHGYILPCQIPGFEDMRVVLGVNFHALVYNPELQTRLDLSLETLASGIQGTYVPIGTGIIHHAEYPQKLSEIVACLDKLYQYPRITCDIETFSLRFTEAGIGTIAFAWSENEGLAFPVDLQQGTYKNNKVIKDLLKEFFTDYEGEIIWHNAAFDIKILIYNLWMQDPLDTEGLLKGLEVMTKNFGDTKVIAYLATNSAAGNKLGLKDLAHEFAGNWAVEVKDITSVPLQELLQYNLVDALSTFFVYKKYYPIMVEDQQEDLYYSLMLPSQKLITQIELTGMPMDPKKIQEAKEKLQQDCEQQLDIIRNHPTTLTAECVIRKNARAADLQARLSKAKNPDKIKEREEDYYDDLYLNPNSGDQLAILLYSVMALPVLDYTPTGQPATGADTLDQLINHTQDPSQKELLQALIDYGKAIKILSTYLPAFEKGIDKGDGCLWLHGSLNLGGTVSGRLSGSDPNLQNIPANSKYAKLVKECFIAPEGWLMVGADYNSLEDMISALTTKDPAKLQVYLSGFDGHSLRASYYFRSQLLDIDQTSPVSVNSIKEKYPQLRQDSKAPTFLLTYGGSWRGMMKNLGWPEDKAKEIEKGYHELYKVSDAYVQDKLKQASVDGYVTVAFGLRVRTPILKQVVWDAPKMPYEAAAEGRTAGNALGQSYGLLNNRSSIEFMNTVRESKYRLDVLPINLIHDAQYYLVRNDLKTVKWVNDNLIKSMQWQELPDIQHDQVKLGAALDVFYINWSQPVTLPNNATEEEILQVTSKGKEKYA